MYISRVMKIHNNFILCKFIKTNSVLYVLRLTTTQNKLRSFFLSNKDYIKIVDKIYGSFYALKIDEK